jgi:uncharacterized protein
VSTAILADASAVVALWSPGDRYHEWAKGCFAKFSPPIFTCQAAMTEAAWLLRHFPARRAALMAAWRRDVLVTEFQAQVHRDALINLMQRYQDIPMSFADSCLVRMSELTLDCVVWTLDTNFKIYRRLGRRTVPLLMPDA